MTKKNDSTNENNNSPITENSNVILDEKQTQTNGEVKSDTLNLTEEKPKKSRKKSNKVPDGNLQNTSNDETAPFDEVVATEPTQKESKKKQEEAKDSKKKHSKI